MTMQTVLSIDISSKTAEAVVASIDGKNIEILEKHSLDIADFLNSLHIHVEGSQPVIEVKEKPDQLEEIENVEPIFVNPISELLSKINYTWNNAILTIPTQEYLSLNIDLPFSDNKSINRILDLEIQDLVPFDIDDFHVSHKSIGISPNSEEQDPKFDTHVGIISKSHINRIMETCHQANFEPFIVTTPPATLGSILNLAPLYFSENSLVIFEKIPSYYILTTFDGIIRSEKVISFGNLNASNLIQDNTDLNKSFLLELKLFIAANEKRYNKNIEKIYYFGEKFSQNDLQNTLARSIECLELKEFLPVENSSKSIAAMAAIYAEESNSIQIINNFRVRQYAYNQKLKYFLRASKVLLPYIGALCFSLFVFLSVKYLVNTYKINRLTSAVNSEIRTALPSLDITPGDELKSLQIENQKLETQLNDISSLSNMTPLDLLLEISKDLPNSLGLSIKAIKIKDNKIVVDGSAKGYSDVENVRKILERKTVYQRVKKSETSSISATPGMRPFSFEIWVKE